MPKPMMTMKLARRLPQISETTSVNQNVSGYVMIPVVRVSPRQGDRNSFTPTMLVRTNRTLKAEAKMRNNTSSRV